MVKVVEELVQLVPDLEPRLFGNQLVVGLEEGRAQPEHPPDAKVVLVVPVEGARIKNDCE